MAYSAAQWGTVKFHLILAIGLSVGMAGGMAIVLYDRWKSRRFKKASHSAHMDADKETSVIGPIGCWRQTARTNEPGQPPFLAGENGHQGHSEAAECQNFGRSD